MSGGLIGPDPGCLCAAVIAVVFLLFLTAVAGLAEFHWRMK